MGHLTWKWKKQRRICTMQIIIYMKIVYETGFFIDVRNLFSAPLNHCENLLKFSNEIKQCVKYMIVKSHGWH